MYTIQRYLLCKICSYTSGLTLLFLMIGTFILLGQTVSQGAIGLGAMDLFKIGWYQVPMTFQLIMPFSWLLAHLMAWRDLIQNSELVAIYSMGMGRLELVRLLLPFSAFISIIMLIVSCWVVPISANNLKNFLDSSLQDTFVDNIIPGQFLRIENKGQEVYIYTEKNQRRLLNNVFVASRKDPSSSWSLMWAKKASKIESQGKWLKFDEGVYYEPEVDKVQLKTIKFKEHGLALGKQDNLKQKRPLMFLTTEKLLNKSTPQVLIELNWRLFFPISSLLLMIWSVIALPLRPSSRDNQKIISVGLLGYGVICVIFMCVQLLINRLAWSSFSVLLIPYIMSIGVFYSFYCLRRSF
ncbi:MAG TPA: LptF/LptG family permease [Gammaproteobacteria bacterium]|nr:LptF/LptG family permease [Gammaproteobacteria bacterium]